MKTLLALSVIVLTGCGSLPTPLCPGSRYYDPQVCRGEQFQQRLSNFPYEALQREQKCNAGIQPNINCIWGQP